MVQMSLAMAGRNRRLRAMRLLKAKVFALGLLCWQGAAQVSVEIVLERDQFLAGEQLLVGVRVTNFSGRTLRLGADPDWLQLTIEGDRGIVVEKYGDPPVVEPFEVPSSARGTRWVDVEPYFNIGKTGSYQITAIVRIPELAMELTSKSKKFLITSGSKIWEQDFGMPPKESAQAAPLEVRKYALVQSLNQNRSRLYVRVSNRPETKIFKLFCIGPMLAFSHPEAQVDSSANLHVLFQTGARTFTYVQVDPDGNLVTQQTYQYTQTRPRLRAAENGSVYVGGGVRIKTSSDLSRGELSDAKPAPSDEKPQ